MYIAILEDNEIKAILLKDAIQNQTGKHSNIFQFKTLKELKNNSKHKFDLIISDLHLPDSSGQETAAFLNNYGAKNARHVLIFSADHELGNELIKKNKQNFSQVKDFSSLSEAIDQVLFRLTTN